MPEWFALKLYVPSRQRAVGPLIVPDVIAVAAARTGVAVVDRVDAVLVG